MFSPEALATPDAAGPGDGRSTLDWMKPRAKVSVTRSGAAKSVWKGSKPSRNKSQTRA